MKINDKINALIKDVYSLNDNEVVEKVFELKGLYSAYEISQNEEILQIKFSDQRRKTP